jgi:hypothetical protein
MIVGKDGCATSTAKQCDRGEDVLRMERERGGGAWAWRLRRPRSNA